MDITNKGFVDERDNLRYVFVSSSFIHDELCFSCELIFQQYNEETKKKRLPYVVSLGGERAKELYDNWSDVRDAYQQLVYSLNIQIELPESMDEELN